MATLVTYGDRLLTSAGRQSWLSRPSVPLAQFGRGTIPLQGDGGLLSFLTVYETQTWIAAAVNKLNRGIMDLPIRLYREVTDDGEVEPVHQHPVMDAILTPWERGSASHLKQKMSFPALIHGNSLLGKVRPEPNAAPTGFVPLDWRFMTAWTLDDGEVYFWETTQPNRRQFWAPEDVVHFAFEAGNGDIGVSPLKQLARTISTEDAAQRYQASSFTAGVRPSGALSTDQDLNDAQVDRISQKVRLAHEGPDRQNGLMLLTNGMKFVPFAHTAVEAELIEQRKLNREEAAAVYDVDPPLIGILDHATYSNVAEMHNRFYRATLRPWLTLITDTLNAQFVQPEPRWRDERLFLAFDLSEVLRSDTPEEIAAVVSGIAGGVVTPNEGRSRLRMRRVKEPAADKLYLPTNNLSPLGEPPPSEPPPPDASQNGDDPVKANLRRVMERAAIKMGAGQDPWDRERFVRELYQDAPEAPAEPLADLVEGLIVRAEGNPTACRRLAASRFR
jgi:HK97 family phage portal protein